MKIPKYILDKMEQRKKLGIKLTVIDAEIQAWLEEAAGVPQYEVLEDPYYFNSILLTTEPEILKVRQIELIERYEKR